jgi:tRNA modification GTPase
VVPADATLVACLTPPGAGAIATLALRGPQAWSVVRSVFRIGRRSGRELPLQPPAAGHWLGRLGEDPAGTCADEVHLVARQTQPVFWLELHCHGGREVVGYLLEILAARGARVCSWLDLERAAASDLTQPGRHAEVDALAALVEAPTVRAAAILLDQYHGAWARSLGEIRAALTANDLSGARTRLAELVRQAPLGRHLTAPWRVVVAGAPNVGKSSLVNALAGYQRSLVAAAPGTTRDVVTMAIAADGWPVELADTAGIRFATADLEQQGIARARAAAEAADLCLWVIDASAPVFPQTMGKPVRLVVNKTDLPAAPGFVPPADAAPVCATLGHGIADLCRALAQWLVPHPPAPGQAVPFTPHLCDRIEEAERLCAVGRSTEALAILDELAGIGKRSDNK